MLLSGCQQEAAPTSSPAAQTSAASQPATGGHQAASESSLTLRVPGLSDQAKLTLQPDGTLLLDGWQVSSQGSVEVRQDGKVVASARQKKDDWLLENASGQPLAKFKLRDDGGYKVVSPTEQTLTKVKPKDYGWKVSGPKEEELYKTRVEKGHIKVKDAKGQEVNKLSDNGQGLLITWLSISELPLETRLALAFLTRGAQGE